MKRQWTLISMLVLLALFSSMGPGTVLAGETFPEETSTLLSYENAVLGIGLDYPDIWKLSEDQFLFPTYGFTLSNAQGGLILRVGWVYDATPEQIEDLIAQQIEGHPRLDIRRARVEIAGYKGVTLSPLPGLEPVSCSYLAVEGRVYEIWYRIEQLTAEEKALFTNLHFGTPQQSLNSLALPPADGMILRTPLPTPAETSAPTAAPGCVDWPTGRFLRVSWDSGANGNGWTAAGPSWYGEGMHRNCDRPDRSNDYHALDFSLREWDAIRAPRSSTVLYYGWASGGFSTLGRVVVLDLGDGYQYLAAHLRGFGAIWYPGQNVSDGTLIGYAGGSGNGQDGYFGNHLHQALYKDGTLGTSGGVYGGRGVEPRNVRYYGNGGGYYQSITRYQSMSW